MKNFLCTCGQNLFFENTHCNRCGKTLGYEPTVESILPLENRNDSGIWISPGGESYRLCANYSEFNVCNWLTPAASAENYCIACRLNQMIPSLSAPENRRWWANMETAKRRLIYTLLQLGLPVHSKQEYPENGLAFAFMEDQRSNPNVADEHILTGHADGLITVNLTEADDVSREWQRETMGEAYRTLLGHFRHESGHYYFDQLVRSNAHTLEQFRNCFGDENLDYDAALQAYHEGNIAAQSAEDFISNYAQAHPLEDWAETWAHYLHMTDTLETATQHDLLNETENLAQDFDARVAAWVKLSTALNSLNRSMGLKDAYPFVLSPVVIRKLRFVHSVVYPR